MAVFIQAHTHTHTAGKKLGIRQCYTKPKPKGDNTLFEWYEAVEMECEFPFDDFRDNPNGALICFSMSFSHTLSVSLSPSLSLSLSLSLYPPSPSPLTYSFSFSPFLSFPPSAPPLPPPSPVLSLSSPSHLFPFVL